MKRIGLDIQQMLILLNSIILTLVANYVISFQCKDVQAYNIDQKIISFCNGRDHSCAVLSSKQVKCWGEKLSWGASSRSDLLSDTPTELGKNIDYLDVGAFIGVEKVSCGSWHTCMLVDTGHIKCLGQNAFGETGTGATNEFSIGKWNGFVGENLPDVNLGNGLLALDVVLGATHSCVKTTGNKAKCFGGNTNGQLGLGDKARRGSSSSHLGDNLPFIRFGSGLDVVSIHSGPTSKHNCVILSSSLSTSSQHLSHPTSSHQRFKCWGLNNANQLGYGDTNDRGDNSGEMGDNLLFVNLGIESRVKQVSLGGFHTCALLINSVLKCWGQGMYGQLGSGSTATILSTGDSMPSVSIDFGKKVSFVSAGFLHTCIVYEGMINMKCFGRNNHGQLGQGDTENRGDDISNTLPNIPNIKLGTGSLKISFVSSGDLFNCVIFENSSVKCFGLNDYAEFAIGSNNDVGKSKNQMGLNLQYSQFF